MKPIVTILMAAYNVEAFIEDSIESVQKQTFPEWRLIVCDDGSSDRTGTLLSSFKDERIRILSNDCNRGFVATKNVLLSHLDTQYGCFLDADDYMAPTRLEVQLGALAGDGRRLACICPLVRVYPDGYTTIIAEQYDSRMIDVLRDEITIPGASVMFKREALEKVGMFEPYFEGALGEDNYWLYRIAELGALFYLNEPLYYYRANLNSVTSTAASLRKMSVVPLIKQLKCQRRQRGTDWLEQGQYEKARQYEAEILKDRQWIGERFREHAAVRVAHNDFTGALAFLAKSAVYAGPTSATLRTALYLARRYASLKMTLP